MVVKSPLKFKKKRMGIWDLAEVATKCLRNASNYIRIIGLGASYTLEHTLPRDISLLCLLCGCSSRRSSSVSLSIFAHTHKLQIVFHSTKNVYLKSPPRFWSYCGLGKLLYQIFILSSASLANGIKRRAFQWATILWWVNVLKIQSHTKFSKIY